MDDLTKFKTKFIELRQRVVGLLIEKHLTISTCESATAGSIASNICDVPGASNIFGEAYVVYSNDSKKRILGIDDDLIKNYGVVSKECALSMVDNLYRITNCDICISITGNLGPDVLEGKASGLIYAGYSYKGKHFVKEYHFDKDRLTNKALVIYEVFIEINNIVMKI